MARTIVTLETYTTGTISTIISLATPHLLPPVMVDWSLVQLYSRINSYWFDSFTNETSSITTTVNPLRDLALVSISGGNHDSLIATDSTLVSWFLPSSNGFAVSTSAIPHVWTTADHKCILWCNQLARAIVRSLYDITDASLSNSIVPLSRRVELLRRIFVGVPGGLLGKHVKNSRRPTRLILSLYVLR